MTESRIDSSDDDGFSQRMTEMTTKPLVRISLWWFGRMHIELSFHLSWNQNVSVFVSNTKKDIIILIKSWFLKYATVVETPFALII